MIRLNYSLHLPPPTPFPLKRETQSLRCANGTSAQGVSLCEHVAVVVVVVRSRIEITIDK